MEKTQRIDDSPSLNSSLASDFELDDIDYDELQNFMMQENAVNIIDDGDDTAEIAQATEAPLKVAKSFEPVKMPHSEPTTKQDLSNVRQRVQAKSVPVVEDEEGMFLTTDPGPRRKNQQIPMQQIAPAKSKKKIAQKTWKIPPPPSLPSRIEIAQKTERIPNPPPLSPRNDFHQSRVPRVEDLRRMKSQLKSSTGVTKVMLDRSQIFEAVKTSDDYYPLEKLKDVFTVASGQLNNLDLTGLDQLTDLFFCFVKDLHRNSLFVRHLETFSLTGCLHVTDQGIMWLTETFYNLRKVYLNGCRLLTEKSVHSFFTHCHQLESLEMKSCRVAVVSPPKTDTVIGLRLQGCPLVSPPVAHIPDDMVMMTHHTYFKDLKKENATRIYRAVAVKADTVKYSFLDFLRTSQIPTKADQPMQVYTDYKLQNGATFNMVEVSQGILDAFIAERTVYILLFDCDEPSEQSATYLHQTILHILTQMPSAIFIIVGLALGNQHNGSMADVRSSLQGKLNSTIKHMATLIKAMNTAVHVDQKPQDFVTQNCSARLRALHDSLSSLNGDVIKGQLQFVESIQLGDANRTSYLNDALLACEDIINKLYPMYTRFPVEFAKACKMVSKRKHKLVASCDVVAALQKELRKTMGGFDGPYHECLRLMNMLGLILLVETSNTSYIVSDLQWLATQFTLAMEASSLSQPNVFQNSIKDSPVISKSSQLDGELSMLFDNIFWTYTRDADSLLLNQLSDEPPLPIDHYMLAADNSGCAEQVTCCYKLLQPPPASLMPRLISNISRVRAPIMVWRTGLILQDVLVEVLIHVEKSDGYRLLMQAQTFSFPEQTKDAASDVKTYLWTALQHYNVCIRFTLQSMSLYYETSFIVGAVITSTDPDKLVDFYVNHRMLTDGSTEVKQCTQCGIESTSLAHFWEMRSCVYPTLNGSTCMKFSEDSVQQRGSWHASRLNTVNQLSLQSLFHLSVEEFSSFSLTILGSTSVLIGARCISEGETAHIYSLDVKNHVLKHDDKEEPLLLSDHIRTGDTITMTLRRPVGKDKRELQWLLNGTLLKSVEVNASCRCFPLFSNLKQVAFLLDCSRSPRYSSVVQWQVGMKLEALDRLNPSLICVATIIKIDEQGNVVIHFDGWTSRYDYTSETSSDDLHPIGFMAQRGDKEGGNPTLQKPKGYVGEFTWEKYLKEEKALPVPFTLFNESQTKGCHPFDFDIETRTWLDINVAPSFKGTLECIDSRNNPSALLQKLHVAIKSTSRLELDLLPTDLPLACMLPAGLDSRQLVHMPYKVVCDLDHQALHFLCYDGVFPHFVDHPGVPFGGESNKISDIADVLCLCTLRMASQSEFLPKQPTELVAIDNSEKIESTVIAENIRKVLIMYAAMYHLWNPNFYLVQAMQAGPMQTIWNAKKDQSPLVSASGAQFVCTSHIEANSSHKGLTSVPLDNFVQYGHFITVLDISDNSLQTLPDALWQTFPELQELYANRNTLEELSAGVGGLRKMRSISLANNRLQTLPSDLADCSSCLQSLDISSNPLGGIPAVVFRCTSLQWLNASDVGLRELPAEVGDLDLLTDLMLAGHAMARLPAEFSKLTALKTLDLSGVRWPETADHRAVFGRNTFLQFLESTPLLAEIPQSERASLFMEADIERQEMLNYKGLQKLSAALYHRFNRFTVHPDTDSEATGGCPPEIFALTKLEKLDLSFHGIQMVPSRFEELTNLVGLNVSHNPMLDNIAAEVGNLTRLSELSLRSCPALKTPPKEIVAHGFLAVRGYLRRLLMGFVKCQRTKLMMVGLGGAGKTSLVGALTRDIRQTQSNKTEVITDGIDITTWSVKHGSDTVTYSVWDFAGQTVYYNTHQFFLSNRAVYLLLWNIRLGYEHAGLDFWLSSIASHAPKAPIIVIGSHKDQVEKFWLPKEAMQKRYPQIAGFHAISTLTGEGLKELQADLLQVTLKEEYMGERIPEAWLHLEKNLISNKDHCNLVTWDEVLKCAVECGMTGHLEVAQAVQFLHDLGSLQHFQNEFLRSKVVINPQWIVDAMSCVVSVHNTPIENGRLYHKDLAAIWKNYDKDLLPWLIRLTEEFDLTFPLPAEKANLVPCLLPENDPKFDWPDVSGLVNVVETMMLYQFDYLPAGLFNRAQVRLSEFSDSSLIWKKGSWLRKKGHLALLTNKKVGELEIKVQGAQPENFLFLIHEVFERLIAESFHGVTYDYFVPCTNCLKMASGEPSMLAASKIRRATELKVPFLQCDKFFHTLSLMDLHAIMPPDNGNDFDVHLEQSLRDLNELHDEMTFDLFMLYAAEDIPGIGEDAKKVAPRRIYNDLVEAGFTVWFSADPANVNIDDVALTMAASKVVLICISDEFVANEHYKNMFHFAQQNLAKTIQLVVLGKGYDWQKTSIGFLVSTEVFVSFTKPDLYKDKISELTQTLNKKIVRKKKITTTAQCFISYAWANSKLAVTKGAHSSDGALGWGDPRTLKDILENNNVVCWMDIERVGEGGLFARIAEGLKHAKVMVACISDEYANSKNCQMEFRHACTVLDIPIILAIVGTGSSWRKTEIGMLSVRCGDVNFQYENQSAYDRLLALIRQHLAKDDAQTTEDKLDSEAETSQAMKQLAFQERLESTQRQFLRRVALYADTMDGTPYPRLLVLDLPDETTSAEDKGSDSRPITPVTAGRDNSLEQEPATVGEKTEVSEDRPLSRREVSTRPVSARPKSKLVRQASVFIAAAHLSELVTANRTPASGGKCLKAKLLCEHEQGWHPVSESFPLDRMTGAEMDTFIEDIAPYMARILAIAKYGSLNLNILNCEHGEQLQKQMEEKCGTQTEFRDEYLSFCALVKALDKDGTHGGLARCHLPNGNVVWLCEEHRRRDKVTVLSDEIISAPAMWQNDITFEVDMPKTGSGVKRTSGKKEEEKVSQASTTSTQQSKPPVKKRTSLVRPSSSLRQSDGTDGKTRKDNNAAKSKACIIM